LPPTDAKTIDKKMDDGIAKTGEVFAYDNRVGAPSCLKNAVPVGGWGVGAGYTDGEYDLSLTEDGCLLIFWMD